MLFGGNSRCLLTIGSQLREREREREREGGGVVVVRDTTLVGGMEALLSV
jgi:hypothetical protein